MSNAAKLKKRAVELEQKKQVDRALALYIQFLQESDTAIDDVDIPLYNRVGDLLMRTGNASDALNYYERAVDLYAERGFLNNAIALCNKVLRQSPGRASIYYKLGKISANKGFKSDAKKNFLEYADRMQKSGQIDEAFRALKEFADLCPDQDDIRLILAEQLTKENRQEEALEQLQKLHAKLDSEGRTAEVRATVDRMKSIDPEAVPRVSGSQRPQKSQDLIFLDTSFGQSAKPRPPAPAMPTPPGRQVSDPDLVVLTLGDQPDVPLSPVRNAAVVDDFDVDVDQPNDASGGSTDLPLLDVAHHLYGQPGASDVEEDLERVEEMADAPEARTVTPLDVVAREEEFSLPSDTASALDVRSVAAAAPLELNAEPDPAPVDLIADQPSYVSGPPLTVDYAGDLAADVTLPSDHGGLFDFRGPPRADDFELSPEPLASLDPDVAFPSFDLDDTALPSADEVTSGGSLAAALVEDITLGTPAGEFDLPVAPPPGIITNLDAFIVDQSATLDVGDVPERDGPAAETSELDGPTSEFSRPPASADLDGLELDADAAHAAGATSSAAADALDEEALRRAIEDGPTPALVVDAPSADRPIETPARTRAPNAEANTPRHHAEPMASGQRGSHERMAGWEVQRAHAERMLEAGDRAGGVRELEEVAAHLERIGDLERALSIIDELIRLSPESVRHHQKRVELAFRSSDRVKLIDAYLELGDALFRSGEERKARVVYQRVLELAPDDPRAQAAVDSVLSMSPPTGSGAIASITPLTMPSEPRHSATPARPRDSHLAYHPGPKHTSRPGNGAAPPPVVRKPAPLDRTAATNGEFVDLGEWLRSGENPKSTRMVTEEKPPSGDEQADFQEMLKRFKQGVAENVDDEDYESHYDLGVAYKEMGLIDEAVAEFQKALRGTSYRVRTYEALGQCFMEKDQYQVAASVLSRAIALGEGDDHHLVGVLYLLGRATEALNKPGAALDYYQRVFAVDIEFRDVAERISEIERKAT